MFDMFGMLGKMREMQDKMQEVKDRLGSIVIEESELGGVVVVEITADRVVKKIKTAPEFYEKYSLEEREEILAEVINNALEKAEIRSKEEMKKSMEGVMPNIPGFDMDNLPFSL